MELIPMILSLLVLAIGSTEFTAIVPQPAVEKVAGGFQFTEGPVWVKEGPYLLFSDIPADTIYKYDPKDGKVNIFRKPSGNSNGLTLDLKGRLITCEHGNRRVSVTNPDGSVSALASDYDGKRLNSPNDAVVKSDGSIYFTDPPYGISPEAQEQPCCGVYRLWPSGMITLLVDDFNRPNGLCFSPDEKILYVADSSELKHVRAFNVMPNGRVANGRIFAELKSSKSGVPDGMKVDCKGNLFSTGPGGIWIFSPDGRHLGTIDTPEVPANCAWGDDDGKTLYITAQKSLYRVRTTTGNKLPGKQRS